ncbi:MAG: twin-arginine translocase TatA/TatE family subunit [Anaerolineae bacterium]|nr:twin-arginine translocase TatA/TatE family subunit [Anaerolineae bacterium]MDW8098936.1 twin-arginine translocase TatA/TatE family subunit [Anaerolineae bacterium]
MPQLGPFELIIILVIVIIIFGVGRLPELGGAIGKGIREFRKAVSEEGTKARTADQSDRDAAER